MPKILKNLKIKNLQLIWRKTKDKLTPSAQPQLATVGKYIKYIEDPIMKKTTILLFLILLSFTVSAQNFSNIICTIWKTSSFCDHIDSYHFIDSSFCTSCSGKDMTCEQMDKKNHLVGVRLTFKNETNNTFEYKTKYNNISIIRKKDNSKIHPIAILYTPQLVKNGKILSEAIFWTHFKAERYINYLKAGNQTDIIMLFPEADKGDKLIIDGFIEAEIE
jgi:hypothetical protein